MRLKAKEIIKVLLSRGHIKQKDLAEILTKETGKKYTQGSLSQKISRGSISYDEVSLIAEILGYEINFTEKQ